jgi:asparagine synthase (glutamine-hydrolysing)
MCGICGVVGRAVEAEISAMTDSMAHRGPDSRGVRLFLGEPPASLGHRRLAIIDPENREADQPFSDPSGRYTIAYNGELFNFRELRERLSRRGAQFRTKSDTEVVLQCLAAKGEETLPELRGMFAFLLWDDETRSLLAARDHLGVKPLYYSSSNGLFVAASELRTVLAHPAVTVTLDPASVVEYLAFGYVTGERTLVDGVRKLPPGHALRFQDDRLEVFEYWDALPPGERDNRLPAEDELAEQLRAAVAASLVSDVPVSLMLSGGLDSSVIAALAAREVDPAGLTAYSVSFGLPSDESEAARRLAGDLGLRHREILLTEQRIRDEFEAWIEGLDVPSANPTWMAVSAIARAVREDGIKVLLSGDGGDELFGGYNRWMSYLRFHDRIWRRTPLGVRRLGGKAVRPLVRGLAGDIARRAAVGGDLFVGSRPFHDDDLARCLGPVGREAAVEHPPEEPIVELRHRFDERFPRADYLAWMCYAALKTDLVEDYLVRLDTMAMRESVEGRVPLLDPLLTRWSFSLSQKQKVDGYQQKHFFRRAVTPLLPEYVTSRPKQGFCPPVAAWASAAMTRRIKGRGVLVEQGLVAPDAFDVLRRDGSTGASFALWALGTLEAWCERNVAGSPLVRPREGRLVPTGSAATERGWNA